MRVEIKNKVVTKMKMPHWKREQVQDERGTCSEILV